MNKIKSVLFVAGISLALAFTFGCSGDDGGGSGGSGGLSSSSKANGQSGSSTLKECDAVFNPDNKFCYEGVVYDKCDGMVYNPTSQICEKGVATPAKCGNVSYNPLTQRCANGVLETKCGSSYYDASNSMLRCQNNNVEIRCNSYGTTWYAYNANYSCCGNSYYDPTNSNLRCMSSRLETKCGSNNWYDASNSNLRCSGSQVQARCGSSWYPLGYSSYGCCGSTLYNPMNNLACSDGVLKYKCGNTLYDDASSQCCMSSNTSLVGAKCGDICYDTSDLNIQCQSNEVKTKCGTSWYDANNGNLRCENDVVETKCGSNWYDASNSKLRCQNDVIETKCGTNWYNTGNTNLRCENDVVETKCGSNWYDASDTYLRCQNNRVEAYSCLKVGAYCSHSWYEYNQQTQFYINDKIYNKCNGNIYNPLTHYCSNGTLKNYGSMTDRSNGKYNTIEIGNQIWMAENLNYNATGSKCYDNSSSNCTIYGRLYNWATAMTVCPSGWHLPSQEEFAALTDVAVGGRGTAGTKLKAAIGWDDYRNYTGGSSEIKTGNGTDDFGFSALPGGYYGSDGKSNGIGIYGYWWSASDQSSDTYAQRLEIVNSSEYADSWSGRSKDHLLSVRCVKD